MNSDKQRVAILLTLALVGVFINVVMFAAGIGSILVVLVTLVLAGWGGWTLKKIYTD